VNPPKHEAKINNDSLGLPLVSCNAYFVGGVLLDDKQSVWVI
jgi:hypothetical protein